MSCRRATRQRRHEFHCDHKAHGNEEMLAAGHFWQFLSVLLPLDPVKQHRYDVRALVPAGAAFCQVRSKGSLQEAESRVSQAKCLRQPKFLYLPAAQLPVDG